MNDLPTTQPRLLTTVDEMLNSVWEQVDETLGGDPVVMRYPRAANDADRFVLKRDRTRPHIPTSTWYGCNCTVERRDGRECLVTMLGGQNVVVAVFSPGFRLRINEHGQWQPEKEELHCSK